MKSAGDTYAYAYTRSTVCVCEYDFIVLLEILCLKIALKHAMINEIFTFTFKNLSARNVLFTMCFHVFVNKTH